MRQRTLILAMCTLASCGRAREDSPQTEPPRSAVATAAREEGASAAGAARVPASLGPLPTPAQALTQEHDAGTLGWVHFARRDDVPLCIFASYEHYYKAPFLKQVGNSAALKAKQTMVFGTYAPGCASRECIKKPTLQCWIDVHGATLSVHTKYSGEQRSASACTTNCEEVTAACETPELPAGTYTIKYGELTRTVKVPGLVREPCLVAQ